jgi:Predicted membrane protein (DUF2157)
LRAQGVLSPAQADAFAPAARGDLVSVRTELRGVLYIGVLLAVSGLGLFLKENHDRLGPAAIAGVVAAAALVCLVYVVRRAPPFSWGATESPHVAVDYLLLLAMLLIAADLGYMESQFRWLGPNWAYHLLIVSLLCFFAAYRFDSRAVLTLALTSFAAWRGVEVGMSLEGQASTGPTRLNAIAVGLGYLAAGVLSLRLRRKPHFEPVYVTGGLLLLFGAMLTGAWDEHTDLWIFWLIAVFVAGVILALAAYRLRRALDFAIGVASIYLVGVRLLGQHPGRETFFLVAGWSIAALVVLIRATRRMRKAAA